jgi:tetratricopeptide (TPR) repeat protein
VHRPVRSRPHIAKLHRKAPVVAETPKLAPVAAQQKRLMPAVQKAAASMNISHVDCEKLRAQAQALIDNEQIEEAAELMKKALAAEPGNHCLQNMFIRFASYRANKALDCGSLECAARRLREILYFDPNNAEAVDALNRAYRAAGANPLAASSRLNVAQCLAKSGRDVGAFVEFQQALRLGDSPAAHKGLAQTAIKLGQKTLALTHLQQALHLNPVDPESWLQLGFLQQDTGHMENAVAAFTTAFKQNPTPVYSEVLVQAAEKAVALAPQNLVARLNLARAYLLAGNQQKAGAEYAIVQNNFANTPPFDQWADFENADLARESGSFAAANSASLPVSLAAFQSEGPQPVVPFFAARALVGSAGTLGKECGCK